MDLWQPTRRELLKTAPLLVGAAALPRPLLAAGPSASPLRFLVVGDWGRAGVYYQWHVARRMQAYVENPATTPHFIVSTGDNFYNFGVRSIRDPHWERSFERIYQFDTPWYSTLGNHDYGGIVDAQIAYRSPRADRWHMPARWYDMPAPHGHTFVDLFFIDTVAWRGKETFPYKDLGSSIDRSDQKKQLNDLIDWLDRSKAPIKLVFGHHAIHSIGKHGGSMEMTELDDVIRHYGVAAYINGHDHCMYHISHRGMHYICSGAGSEMLSAYTGNGVGHCVSPDHCPADKDERTILPVWHSFLAKDQAFADYNIEGGFAAFQVFPDRIDFQFFDSDIKRPRVHEHSIPVLPRTA